MFRCNNCYAVFEETATDSEAVGSWGDSPQYEEYEVCPECGSISIEEMDTCEDCGEPCIDALCDDCLNKYITLDNAIKVGDLAKEPVLINSAVTCYLTETQINQILEREMKATLKVCDDLGMKPNSHDVASDYFYDFADGIYENLDILEKKEK